MRISWNAYFMILAKISALRSSCNSRPGGAVVVFNKRVVTTGFTGTIPGKPQCSDKGPDFCHRRSVNGPEDDKYNICPSIHAEQNAIIQAAKLGVSIEGSIMYCTLSPCYVCLKMIAGVGITKVYYELSYESTDKERDRLWNDFNKVDIVGEELTLTNDEKSAACDVINSITSKRRLKSK